MQVSAATASGIDREYKMASAILLYKEKHSGQMVFASVHDVEIKNGLPTIESGVAVSKTALVDTLKSLVPEDYAPVELLGEHILAKGHDHLAWFVKPQKRQVWFKCEEFGEVTAQTDHPGLVFIVTRDDWYVFAVKGDSRPTPSTPLYVAPYFNVWEQGRICTGNIEIPKGASKFNTVAWEEAWFRSYFTHPNIHETGGLTKYRGGIFSLWRALMKGLAFPVKSLVDANETLAEAFERVVEHGSA